VPTAIHLAWPIERIDAQYNGDDCLLRLFISIEFRRALRDRLIAQQRENNRLAAAASIRQQQRVREERDRREHDERERVEREKAERERVEREKVERERVEQEMASVVGKEEWQWELKDTSSANEANEAAGFLQRATNNVVDGTVATAQTIVGGTLATIGGAARATSAGGRVVSNAVGTLVSSTAGLLK
jgi:acetoin utilization deacetylase AcuC-like enzyme